MASIRSRFRARALVGALLALACAAGEAPATEDPPALEACASPRPERCTQEVRPACGHRCAKPPCAEDQRRRYTNACTACMDPRVRAVSPGACDGADATGPVILR